MDDIGLEANSASVALETTCEDDDEQAQAIAHEDAHKARFVVELRLDGFTSEQIRWIDAAMMRAGVRLVE